MNKDGTNKNTLSGVTFDIEICDLDILPNMTEESSDGVFDEHTDQLLISMDEQLMQQGMSQSSEIVDDVPPANSQSSEKEADVPPAKSQSSEIVDEGPPAKMVKPDKSHLLAFIDMGLNKNTKRKTQKETGRFIDYVESQGESREITELTPNEMDYHVGSFFMQLKKPNGDLYEPSTLTSYQR